MGPDAATGGLTVPHAPSGGESSPQPREPGSLPEAIARSCQRPPSPPRVLSAHLSAGELPSGAGPRVPGRAGPVVAGLAAAAFIVSAEARVVAPLLPAIAASLGVSVAAAGSAVTLYLLPYGLCQLVYGPLGDRLGKLRLIRSAMVVLAAGTAACALAPTLLALDVLRLATGIAAAAVVPMALAHLGDTLPYAERPRAIGVLMAGAAAGQTVSMGIGGVVGELLSWRFVFALYGAVALAVALRLARLERDTAVAAASRDRPCAAGGAGSPAGRGSRSAWTGYVDLVRLPAARALYLTVAVEGFSAFGPFAYIAAHLQARDGLSTLGAGLVLVANGLGAFVGARLVAAAVRRLGERGAIVTGALVMGVPYLLLATPLDWRLAPLALLVMGAGFPIAHAVLQTRATELAPAARGTSLSLFAFSLFLGGGLGTAVHGLLVAGPGSHASMAAGGVGLCAYGLLAPGWLGLRGTRRRPPASPRPAATGD